MKRSEFIKKSIALGVSAPFLSMLLESCKKENFDFPQFDVNFSGKVYKPHFYGVEEETGRIDMDKVEAKAIEVQPKFVCIFGQRNILIRTLFIVNYLVFENSIVPSFHK